MAPHLSRAVPCGDLVFVSGQLARDDDGTIAGDIVAQTERALANLKRELARFGLDLTAVRKTTVWLRDRADAAGFDATYASVFGAVRPARSLVISALVAPEALVEIEAIAERTPA